MKNIDKIQIMSVDELAEWLSNRISCQCCPVDNCKNMALCEKLYKQWLKKESEE